MYRTDQRTLPIARQTSSAAQPLVVCLALCFGAIFLTSCTSEGLSNGDGTEQPELGEAQAQAPAQPQNPFEPATEQTADPETTNPPAGQTGDPDTDNPPAEQNVDPEPANPPAENPNSTDPGSDPGNGDTPPVEEEAAPPSNPVPDTQTETITRAECGEEAARVSARMLDLLNETRASARNCGSQSFAAADPLVLNDKLAQAAAGHSLDMSSVNFFDLQLPESG